MKNVYLVQPNNSLSDALFLPYAVGSIAAYSLKDTEICNNYKFCDFIFTKMPIEQALKKIASPFVIGFSCYMWNIEYNLFLAYKVKKKYPQALIVFGGPQVPNDTSYLEEYDFIDVLIHGEGEVAFFNILKSLISKNDFSKICNISYRDNEKCCKTALCRACDLSDFPSPYAEGLFDSIINNPEYSDIQFDAIVETNRGCPYKCIYCCWAGNKDSFRKFSDERIKKDLEWIAKNKISYCICADSNFGMLERDEKIVDYIIELKQKFGYPQKFETTAAKNKDDLLFRINKKLDSVKLNRGISVAVQSMSPEVLNIIGRKNMSVNNLSEQLGRYREAGMYTYTDIILGLPGETFESFSNGLFAVIEAGQHNSININRCEFLPNTPMYSDEFKHRYGIKTIRSNLCQNHSKVINDMRFSSRSELVIETNTMSREDWRRALRLSVCVQSFHCLGLLRFISIFFRKARNISYREFYLNLFTWIETESVFVKTKLDYACKSIDDFLYKNGNLSFSDSKFGNIYWPFEEALFLCIAYELEEFYKEINAYLSAFLNVEDSFIIDLCKYQKNIISLPLQNERELIFKYDWPAYFNEIYDFSVVSPKEHNIAVKLEKSEIKSWSEYARHIVWYGKRDDKTINKISYINPNI